MNIQPILIEFPKIEDERGKLSVIESGQHIPFDIKRVFYMYDIESGHARGAHAHRELHQVLVCLSGNFDVTLDNGYTTETISLQHPWQGLHIPPFIWATETNFSNNSVCMVLASDVYNENDYFRNYDDFLRAVYAVSKNE